MTAPALSNVLYARLALSKLAAPERVLKVEAAGITTGLRLAPVTEAKQPVALMTAIDATVGAEPVRLYLPTTIFEAYTSAVFGKVVRSRFPREQAALLFESALAEPIEALERLLGAEIAVTAAGLCRGDHPLDADINLRLSVEHEGNRPLVGYASLPFAVFNRIVDLWNGAAGGFDPRLPVAAVVGATVLTKTEVDALRPGDVIMLDRSPLLNGQVMLAVDDQIVTFLTVTPEGTTLNEAFTVLDRLPSRYFKPEQPPQSSVIVTAQLVSAQVRLAELMKLKVGAPVPLPHGITGPVELKSGADVVAVGRLVRVENDFGVDIVKRS
jgi:flagellar motor switch/type III secretory pathway protein FliN